MVKNIRDVYNIVDKLQLAGDYAELNQLAQYVVDAILNDDEALRLQLPTNPTITPVVEADPVQTGVISCR